MKVIVDTNVLILVSAIISDNIPEQVIMWIISKPLIEWVATATDSHHPIVGWKSAAHPPKLGYPPKPVNARLLSVEDIEVEFSGRFG